jgi:hypothetical protein
MEEGEAVLPDAPALGHLHDYLVLTAPMQRAVDPCEGLVMPAAPAR